MNPSAFTAFCAATLILCFSVPVVADDDEEDLIPGLIARYAAETNAVDRVDPDVQFDWGEHPPDVRLPAGPFSAKWTGKLLIRAEGRHAFHLYLCGEATLTLNGKIVLRGRRDTPGWAAGELTDVGDSEVAIEVAYRKTGKQAVVRLFWSSETFPTEPIPPQLFFRETPRRELDLAARGSELFGAFRCQACHRGGHDEPADPAPALMKHGSFLRREWLINWLMAPHRQTPRARMPQPGLSRGEAQVLADYLLKPVAKQDPTPLPVGEMGPEPVRRGEVLFRSIGCLACHTHGDDGNSAAPGGGDLTDVAGKRSAGWVYRWLKDPEMLNRDHRMPVFKLTDDERRSLALYLCSAPDRNPGGPARQELPRSPEKAALAESGEASRPATAERLIETARCAACHRFEGIKSDVAGIPTLEQPVKDWSKACTEVAPGPSHIRPSYALADGDRLAIRAFVDSRSGPRSTEEGFARGERLLRQKGCVNCHERDAGQGIAAVAGRMARLDPDLAGQSESLVPPRLTAAGDKLRDEALSLAISGRQKTNRLPWLRVRMPQFEHAPEDAAALVTFLVGHDRIPAGAPRTKSAPVAEKASDAVEVAGLRKIGQLLAGTRGFSCTACHKIAGHEPRNVALATHGSDLYLVGQRMRPEFFVRWTRSPLRVVPGMEMPSFERPVAGILEGDIERQLAALWEGLNDRSAPPKIDTSTVENLVVVETGGTPKIIRDVFNVGNPLEPRLVPRAMAIGFDHGVSLLFDLDAMAVQDTWSGDFARQRSSGKSWYWEPAGAGSTAAAWDSPDVVLRKTSEHGDGIVKARKESGRSGRLKRYVVAEIPGDSPNAPESKGVEIEYTLSFELADGTKTLNVAESIFPTTIGSQPPQVGCERRVTVQPIPAGYDILLRSPQSPEAKATYRTLDKDLSSGSAKCDVSYRVAPTRRAASQPPAVPHAASQSESITAVPGYDAVRLPMPLSIMPTAIAWTSDGTLAFCSLKGEVFLAKDTDGDGIEDKLIVFEEGLAAPYGLIADGEDLIVAHKPELLRLRDTDGDGRADVREVIADGWGYTDDYHDWTTGIIRDSLGNLYVGTGSDYARPGRDREKSKWRGKVLRIDKSGQVTPVGHGFRYPTGLAITADDQVFVSDNQGVQNTFNEINHLVDGASYGVPSQYEENPGAPAMPPAIQIPHPWTRSVNGLFFLPRAAGALTGDSIDPFAGHGIGCEYDSRFLVRFTLQPVGNTYQGAVYPFSMPTPPGAPHDFLGTLCGAVSPKGDIYIGSIYDSGWLGGPNIGDLVRLRSNGKLPVGIREIRAGEGQFRISFTAPISATAAVNREKYEISGYTRKWQGSYATPDSGRHQLVVESVDVAADRLSITLQTSRQQIGHVYEITCGKIGPASQPALWPAVGHYTWNEISKP